MKVPLTVYYTHQLLIMHGKCLTKIPAPMMPYIMTTKKSKSAAKSLRLIDLGSKAMKTVYVYEFRSDAEAAEKAINLKNSGYDVSYLRFLETMFVDHPDFFRKYENGAPDVMALDIEVLTDGSGIFPNPNNNPIICIGAKYMDEPEIVFEISVKDLKRPYPDERVIIEFLEYFREKNPDILITYNGRRFDIPFLITRSQYCGINLSDFSRVPSQWEDKGAFRIPGHVHYDIFDADTDRDQSLLGIKNKKLKTVAEWFKIPHEELTKEELTNTKQLIGTKKLRKYQKSDVSLLWELYKIYSPMHLNTAEIMGIPLEFIINDYPSFVPKIMSARKLRNAGYLPLDSNEKRYHELEGKYQAAYVDILKHGFIKKVYKLDFSGFYPTTMVNFNLSPETTRLVKKSKFTDEDDFKFKLKDNQLWLQIPDKNLRKNLIIKVDQSKPGLISDELRLLMDNRSKLKAKIKNASLDEVSKIKAITDTLKVQINSIYGIQGLGSTEYGDMSTAIAIVGICRWIIKQLVDKYHDKVIEVDTDGIYTDSDVEVEDAEKYIYDLIRPITSVKDLIVNLDREVYGSGYFHLSKNYLYRELKEGRIVFHGVAFKSSRHCLLYDKILTMVADMILEEENKEIIWEKVSKFMDLEKYPLNHFIMTTKINKPVSDYVNENCLQKRLAEQAKETLKIEPYLGMQIEYVVTKGKSYKISALIDDKSEIDHKYYVQEIYKALKLFGLEEIHQNDLFGG